MYMGTVFAQVLAAYSTAECRRLVARRANITNCSNITNAELSTGFVIEQAGNAVILGQIFDAAIGNCEILSTQRAWQFISRPFVPRESLYAMETEGMTTAWQ